MKLKNKKTGEIKDTEKWVFSVTDKGILFGDTAYNSLAELCDEWEDYEEPKENWFIEPMNEDYIDDGKYNSPDELERYEELGLIFNTKEEAEKAVEKLKAWKRLKDKGFRFEWWKEATGFLDYNKIAFNHFAYITDDKDQVSQDLDLLFGGEE